MTENERQVVKNNSSPEGGAMATVAVSLSMSRIVRNTLMLYFRQVLIMLVSLYTVRAVLATLGAEDYGIYNVVAGVVVMFGFINSALDTANQRCLSGEIVRQNFKNDRALHKLRRQQEAAF